MNNSTSSRFIHFKAIKIVLGASWSSAAFHSLRWQPYFTKLILASIPGQECVKISCSVIIAAVEDYKLSAHMLHVSK